MSSDLTPIAAYDIFANGKSVPAPDLSPTPAQDAAYRWLHFDLTANGVDDWLDAHLPPSAANALQELETRPRIEEVEDGLIVTLRGVNMNEGADVSDMVALRLWISRSLVVTVRRRRIYAVEMLRREIEADSAPHSAGEFVAQLTEHLIERIEAVSLDLDEKTDVFEELLYDDGEDQLPELAPIRRRVIKMRRHLGPLSTALERLAVSDSPALGKKLRSRLHENANRALRSVEELSEIRERLTALSEHLDLVQTGRLARNGYVLSVVAAIFVPMSFVTGLMGMNVGGIPGADNPYAFWGITGGLMLIGVLVLGILRYRKWL